MKFRFSCTSREVWVTGLLLVYLLVTFLKIWPLSYGKAKRSAADIELAELEEEFYNWHTEQAPEFSTVVGEKAHNNKLTDFSMDILEKQYNAVLGFLEKAKAIDRKQLSREYQYHYDTFLDTLNVFTNNFKWKDHGPLNPVNFMDAFYLIQEYIVEITPFETLRDFRNFISRLEARPVQVEQIISRLQASVKMGTTNNWVSMKDVPDQIQAVTIVAPADSVLYEPFKSKLDKLDIKPEVKDKLRNRAQQAIQEVWGALIRLSTYISKDYAPHTRVTYGVQSLPAGGDYYRECLKWHLSLDLTPAQVHQTGIKEVERINNLMREVMERQGFSGTVAQYYAHLKKQPEYHLDTAEEIIKRYEDIIEKKIYPRLPEVFRDIPPGPVSVKPLPYDGPYGSYWAGSEDGTRPGIFYTNVIRPQETLTFGMMSLTLHETVPGHHLQYLYQRTSADLPNFMKNIEYDRYFAVPYHFPFYTAYAEGWGLYAEYLGEELGMYKNDSEMMGRYGDEISRACRLVVDTGLHGFGWSRDQAIDYLLIHTPMSQTEAEIEIDRYITWPGQACAYKIGEMKIKQLRKRAANALGSLFDVRDFHFLLLNHGPMPLSVMETIVNDYITDSGGRPDAGSSSIIIG